MSTSNSVDIVHAFWDQVWNAHDAPAVDRFVVDDFIIVTGGETITGRENFKHWIAGFLTKINDLHLEVTESFQNADGSRVASRWLLTGKNNGFPGTATRPTGHHDDRHGRLGRTQGRQAVDNHVERAVLEQLQRLTATAS